MIDQKKIKKEGVKLIEEFSRQLEKIPETEETHYVMDVKNITREDKKAVQRKEFRKRFRKIVPRMEDDYVVTEKGQ